MGRKKVPKVYHDYMQLPIFSTTGQVAAFFQVSAPLIRKIADAGELKGQKVGTQWRFHRDRIREFGEGRQIKS